MRCCMHILSVWQVVTSTWVKQAVVQSKPPSQRLSSVSELSVQGVQVLIKVYKALGTDKDFVTFSQRFKAAHPGYRPGECGATWT